MNRIKVSGVVTTPATMSHEVYGEKFYKFDFTCERESGTVDVLPCIVSELYIDKINEGDSLTIIGKIRTRNVQDENGKSHCEIKVFVSELADFEYACNEVEIKGVICKQPKLRNTPLGREITDLLVASNRERSHKSDYIPCITWGRNAIRTSLMKVSDKVKVFGRFQSREYVKRYENDVEEIKTALEVSVNIISEVADES